MKIRTALLLVACIAVTPFCWLVSRDYLMLSGVTGVSESHAQFLLVERLAESARDLGLTARRASDSDLTPACVTIPVKDRKAATEAERALGLYRNLAMETLFQMAGRNHIEASFSKHEMIFLSACMQATPLARWCQRKFDGLADDTDGRRQKQKIKLGVLRPVSGRDTVKNLPYCDTLPKIVADSAKS